MFQLDHPEVVEVLRNSTLLDRSDEFFSKVKDKKITVVSVFGSSSYQFHGYKRAFRLAIDGFGTQKIFSSGDPQKPAVDERPTNFFSPDDTTSCGENTSMKKSTSEDNADNVNSSLANMKISDGEDGKSTDMDFPVKPQPIPKVDVFDKNYIDGFYCVDQGILFLQLSGAFDSFQLIGAAEEMKDAILQTGFIPFWTAVKSSFCSYLLLMFCLSHILILSDSGNSLDTSYLNLFRMLDAVRVEIKSRIGNELEKIEDLSKDWITNGRLCSPRLLFLFEVTSGSTARKPDFGFHNSDMRKIQSQENDIFHILRKCRIITNFSADSLFAIPSNDQFVFLFDKSVQNASYEEDLVSYVSLEVLRKSCDEQKPVPKTFSPAYRSSSGVSMKQSFKHDSSSPTYQDTVRRFKQFVLTHTRVAATKGFTDDSRRTTGHKKTFFVQPTFHQWLEAYKRLHPMLTSKESDT